jgi:hypothetical protein
VGSSTDQDPVLRALDGGTLTLTPNRPEQRHALDDATREGLAAARERALRATRGRPVRWLGACDPELAGR